MSETSNRVLLPTNVKPEKYRLTLQPDLEKFTFRGEQEVDLTVNEDSNRVVVNANELEIQSAEIVQGDKVLKGQISYDKENEYAIFQFDDSFSKGSAVLKLHFTGELNNKMAGFYRSKYVLNGETRYMATTQFEATDARKAFPCWDEPAVKSIFEVSLIAPKDRTALSNMNEVSTKDYSDDLKIVTFAPSPIMSTYLLAFIVGEFDFIEQKASNGVDVRVYVPKTKQEQGKFGLDVAVKVLPLLEDYFGQKYPLPKLDLVAIPDFAAGAMENWGLVTYRETALLVDPVNSSAHSRQWVALVVAHEISHQWFGNLVTMEWWQDLWLNEGFATWVEYFAVDKLFPEWNIFEQFVHDDFGRALSLDGLESSHPIEVPIRIAAEVDEIFDAISYSKGCAVIRMLVEYLSVDVFRNGLLIYLERHKYANAATNDLWAALSESSKKDVSSMMTTWTRQTGYPVITINEVSRDNNKRKLKLTQNRFLSNGVDYNDQSLWHIPITYVTNNGTSQPILMTERSIEIEVDDYEWIKLNPGQSGFYRVSYPNESYESLTVAIKQKKLGAIDRLGVQEDAVSLARAGVISTSLALTVLSGYADEDNYTVFTGVSSNLNEIWGLIKRESFAEKFKIFARGLFVKKGKELGWDPKSNESHLTTMLRALVISNLARYDEPETINEALDRFPKYLKQNDLVVPDLRTTLYTSNIKNKGKEAYDQVMNIYNTTDLNEERIRCLKSFGAVQDDDLIQKTLESSVSDKVRSQDAFYVVLGVVDNIKGAKVTWQFFKDNFETFKTRYDGGGFLFGRIIKTATQGLMYDDEAEDVEKFFETRQTPSIKRTVAQSLEVVKLNGKWLKSAKSEIDQWLNDHKY